MTEQREYVEAKVLLADWQLERFIEFCEEELGQLPELSRVTDGLNGYREFFELLAAKEDGRLTTPMDEHQRN